MNNFFNGLLDVVFNPKINNMVDRSERPYSDPVYLNHNTIKDIYEPSGRTYELRIPIEPLEQGHNLQGKWGRSLFHDPVFQRDYMLKKKMAMDNVPPHYQITTEGMERRPAAQHWYDHSTNLVMNTWDETIIDDTRFVHMENEFPVYYNI